MTSLLTLGTSAALRATALLLGAGALGVLLRRATGGVRHGLWSVTIVALLALPVMTRALPRLDVPTPAWTQGGAEGAASAPDRAGRTGGDTPASPERAAPYAGRAATSRTVESGGSLQRLTTGHGSGRTLSLGAILALVWMSGALLGLGALASGLRHARRVSRSAVAPADPAWLDALDAGCRRLGVRRRVRIGFTRAVTSPVTGGLLRPVVLLPDSARMWSAERRELVLLHELVHVARGDALRHVLSRVATALYWFHPLAWWAARQGALAREEACDEAVLACGHRASTYARHLLELAEPEWLPLPALARLERPQLEKRLMAILRPSRIRSRRWLGAATASCAAVWALSVAAVSPRAAPPAAARMIDTGARPEPSRPVVEVVDAGDPPPQESVCWSDRFDRFDGSFSTTTAEGGRRTTERYGFTGRDYVVQTHVGDVQVCLRSTGDVEFGEGFEAAIGDGGRVTLEAADATGTQRMEMVGTGSDVRTTWTVDGAERPVDARAEEWRDAMFDVIGKRWAVSRIRGEVSSLRGEISSIRGRESSLRGEISSIRGHVSSLRGEISSIRGRESTLNGRISTIRGRESTLRGEVSTIHGQESTLRGRISTLRGRISTLQSASRASESAATRRSLDEETETIQRQIGEIERRIEEFDAAGRVEEVERRIREYDADARVREVEERRSAEDVAREVREIEEEIARYDAESRIREVEGRMREVDVQGEVSRVEREIEGVHAEQRVAEIERGLPAAETRLVAAVRAVR